MEEELRESLTIQRSDNKSQNSKNMHEQRKTIFIPKKGRFLWAILYLVWSNSLVAMEQIISWQLVHPISGDTIFVGEKGSVQEALINAKLLPDPLVDTNERAFDWIENHRWIFIAHFILKTSDLNGQILELELPSVDTYADIYLNEERILQCENAFLPYRIPINKWAKMGENYLKIVFTPPILFHQASYKKAKYKLPTTNDTHKIAIAPYTRKPQYQFGWDWTFRMNTIGLNKAVTLVGYSKNKIVLTNVQTLKVEHHQATLSIAMKLSLEPQKKLRWTSKLFGNIDFQINKNWLEAQVNVEKAQLWWPKNHGGQFLYHDTWILTDDVGTIIDSEDLTFGIRTVKLVQEADQWGTSYQIVVNERPIFCKGGNYIPQEVFLSKITDSSTIYLIDQADSANFNLIRIWGGGYYPDDIFYHECDKRGIMVWQDFMFACAMYPGTEHFLENVQREVQSQIPRIASHPSVVLFNGNNEVAVAWKYWGYQLKYGLVGKSAKTIKRAYTDLFEELLPKCVARLSSVPYVHTSPLSHWGKDEYYRHGSQHYWGVWHGKDPLEDFGNKSGRFNAEYGFQSFPEYATLNKVIEKKDWNLDAEVMKLRQKSYVGNKMIKKHADLLFGASPDFKTFVYYSQLTQARALQIAIAAHRIDWPRCSGTIYWQLNDCWPAPTWSTVDYYGKWKAAHYQVQKSFKNVAVIAVEKTLNKQQFFIVSDWIEQAYNTSVRFDFFDRNGKLLTQQVFDVELHAQTILELPVFEQTEQINEYIVKVSWTNENGELEQEVFSNISSFIEEKHAKIDLELVKINDNDLKIVITCDKPLFHCWIYSETKNIHLNRNFETLLPGKHEFSVLSSENITLDDIFLRFL